MLKNTEKHTTFHNSHKNLSCFANQPKIKNNSNFTSKKTLNAIDFIKQKNKFLIKDNFDEKGTRNFLSSKNIALMEIKLNEEIPNSNNYNDTAKINNNSKILLDNVKKIEKIDENHKKLKNKIIKNRTLSPRKKRGKNDKKLKNKNTKNNIIIIQNNFENENEKDSDIGDIEIFDNKNSDCDFVYKFIIDNVNEPENQLIEKLNKEIKRNQTAKLKKEKHNLHKSKSSNDIKNSKNDNKGNNKRVNPFYFSETAKNLMILDGLQLSIIDDIDKNIQDKNKKNDIGTSFTSIKKGNNKNSKFKKSETIENDELLNNINSEKEFINLLSNLM